jgi:hypothetical protein
MDVVWDAEGPVTPGQAHDELRRTRKLAYTTAMTIHREPCGAVPDHTLTPIDPSSAPNVGLR